MMKKADIEMGIDPCVFMARLLGNDVLTDECGTRQTMVPVPRMWQKDVLDGAPQKPQEAFLVDHDEKDVFWATKYPAAMAGAGLASVPGAKAAKGLSFDQATAACNSLGDGWHLMTNAEWAAIGLRCRRASTPYPGAGQTHDGTVSGIYGLAEGPAWVGGVRVVDGEIQIIPHNNAAITGIDQGADSGQWRSVSPEGALLLPGHAQALHVGFAASGIQPPLLLKGLALEGLGRAGMAAPAGEALVLRGGLGASWDGMELVPREACRPDVLVYACYIAL